MTEQVMSPQKLLPTPIQNDDLGWQTPHDLFEDFSRIHVATDPWNPPGKLLGEPHVSVGIGSGGAHRCVRRPVGGPRPQRALPQYQRQLTAARRGGAAHGTDRGSLSKRLTTPGSPADEYKAPLVPDDLPAREIVEPGDESSHTSASTASVGRAVPPLLGLRRGRARGCDLRPIAARRSSLPAARVPCPSRCCARRDQRLERGHRRDLAEVLQPSPAALPPVPCRRGAVSTSTHDRGSVRSRSP